MMPRLSQHKKDKIAEHILHYLFTISPQTQFTNKISQEVARDEEFIKAILKDLESKKLVIPITKNSSGSDYLRRIRWRLSNEAFSAYNKQQPSPSSTSSTSTQTLKEKDSLPNYIG